jgi:photosystem II stability/assembly factor-like uncharacterized protein
MRALLLLVLVLTACTNQPNAGASPTPSPTASPTATATQSPTSSPTASPSPITLPSIAQLSAPSGTVVWALVAGTRLFRSSDRGDTWTERSLPTGLANVEVAFADDKVGLLLSTGSPATQCQTQTVTIWRTTDGAGTWQQLAPSGIADAMCKRGLGSADATHAFFTASNQTDPAIVYRTSDGGMTWQASGPLAGRSAAVYNMPGRPRAFGAIVLLDATPAGQSRAVFRSQDSGATFGIVSAAPLVEAPVAFVTQARWLQLGPPGSSQETTDGGASWHAFTTDYSQAAPISPDVVFGDGSVGYATVRGAIQRTTDGGAHWTAIKTPGTV